MSAGAHAAVSPTKKKSLVRSVVGLTGTIGLAIVIGLVATGGTYALWNTKATVNASSVSSGSTAITINSLPSYPIPQLDTGSLLPGRSVVSAPLDLKNTGTTPVSITLGAVTYSSPANALSSSLAVYVRQSATCEATAFGTTPQSFTTPIVLAAGANTKVCVEVRLPSSAPTTVQGQSATFSVQLDAVQKR